MSKEEKSEVTSPWIADAESEDGFDVVNPFDIDFEKFYQIEGRADLFHFKTHYPGRLSDIDVSVTENDAYLEGLKPIEFFGDSIKNVAEFLKEFKHQSGLKKDTSEYEEFVELHQPRHGVTEGGKGLTFYTHPVIFQTAGMSDIINFNISFGCTGSCSFCKESTLGRSFTQADLKEISGIIKISFGGQEREVPSKIKVKFWDTNNKIMVYGPIQIPIHFRFPISKDSLRKIMSGKMFRCLAD